MNATLEFCAIGLPVSLALRSRAAFVSNASHFCFVLVPVLVHLLVGPCAAVGQFVQLTDWRTEAKRAERLALNVGQDRLAASEWMPCGTQREVRRGGHLA
jgi:hypothetical protein